LYGPTGFSIWVRVEAVEVVPLQGVVIIVATVVLTVVAVDSAVDVDTSLNQVGQTGVVMLPSAVHLEVVEHLLPLGIRMVAILYILLLLTHGLQTSWAAESLAALLLIS